MSRAITLFTGQWADLDFEVMCAKAKEMGFDGLELACWGNHIEVDRADDSYCKERLEKLKKYNLKLFTISSHLVGQAVCDVIDERHKSILPDYIWGDGSMEGVRRRAADEMIKTARVASRLGLNVVNGFTGSPIWHLLYSFPPLIPGTIEKGYKEFAKRWLPILDEFKKSDVRFALEVHPTEIAFDIVSAQRALDAVNGHPSFGFNYDPSHLAYQGVDYIDFIYTFSERIYHAHMKDVYWSDTPMKAGVFGGHTEFGNRNRFWDFRSIGHGNIDFKKIVRALNDIGYSGPLSIEWEDVGMEREKGAAESLKYLRDLDFAPSSRGFDDSFSGK